MTRAVDVVRRIAPRARPTYVAAFERGDALLIAHGVTTPGRLTHFLAQSCTKAARSRSIGRT